MTKQNYSVVIFIALIAIFSCFSAKAEEFSQDRYELIDKLSTQCIKEGNTGGSQEWIDCVENKCGLFMCELYRNEE